MRVRYAMAVLLASALSSAAYAAPARYLVTFDSVESAARAIDDVAAQPGKGWRHVRHAASGGEVFEAEDRAEDQLRALPGVNSVHRERTLGVMSDGDMPWHLGTGPAGINLGRAWERSRGAGVTVAVIDTGIVPHSALGTRIKPGYDFIDDEVTARDGNLRDENPRDEGTWGCGRSSDWHGTAVAGVIAAAASGALMGVAPEADVIPVRVAGQCGAPWEFDVADAIVWASGGDVAGVPSLEKPADIINLSLGSPYPCDSPFAEAVAEAISRGSIVVAAAGNEPGQEATAPAMCDGVIAVGALGINGSAASYVMRGPWVTVSAPGGEESGPVKDRIWTTSNTGVGDPGQETEAAMNGSSFATPLVSGVVALMRAMKPDLTASEAKRLIVENARPGLSEDMGGRLDASATLDALAASMN